MKLWKEEITFFFTLYTKPMVFAENEKKNKQNELVFGAEVGFYIKLSMTGVKDHP